MSIIRFDNVKFTYDGRVNALDGVTLAIEAGELVCVLGGNGSGKSTLARHMNALLVPDEGEVRVLGRSTSDASTTYFVRSSVGMVFQNPDDQIVASVIEDDVAFGPENLGIGNPELRERVTEALLQVGMQGFEKKETAALSGGQKQRVAIAGVLAMRPAAIVFDEATAMLDPRGRAGFMRVCNELREAGLAVVVITHFMEEAALADRVVVLDAGRVVLEGAPDEVLTRADVLEPLALEVPFSVEMARELYARGVDVTISADESLLERELKGRLHERAKNCAEEFDVLGGTNCGGDISGSWIADGFDNPRRDALQASVDRGRRMLGERPCGDELICRQNSDEAHCANFQPSEAVVEFTDVSFTYQPAPKHRGRRGRNAVVTDAPPADWGNDPAEQWALRGVSFTMRRGELLGIAGHTGSGKSTLIQLCNGLLSPTSGVVKVNGADIADKRAATEARREVGVVFQYPERQLFAATVFDDVAFGPRNLGLSADEVEERVKGALELVHLDPDGLLDRSPFALSGGQQRRIALAGVLAMRPRTLVLDEPAAGLDPRARAALLQLVRELHREGLTVAIVSHSMDDLAELAERILVLNRGELFALGTPAEVFSDEEALKQVGLGVPNALRLANGLGLGAEASRMLAGRGAFGAPDLAELIAQKMADAPAEHAGQTARAH